MRVLFVHRRGPGQFVHLAGRLASEGWNVTLVCETSDRQIPGVRVLRHRAELPPRRSGGVADHLAVADYHMRLGCRVTETIETIRRQDGEPDLVIGHIGWGGLMFARDVLPRTPILGYCEFFYRAEGADLGFDPASEVTLTDRQRIRARNLAQLATLETMDAGFSPTRWQRSLYPAHHQRRLGVCHDGIDVRRCRPNPNARFTLPDGRVLQPGDPVVTFAARDLEPYRGFPQFMRAAAMLARERPDVVFAVAGGHGVSYGQPAPDGRPWREVLVEETGIDPSRIHFLGTLPHEALIRLFQVSAVHAYLTYPFVLSWSLLEAMACGALVVASATAPVREFVANGRNGLLTDFFDEEALARTIGEALDRRPALTPLRAAARNTIVARAALETCLDRQASLIDRVIARTGARRAADAQSLEFSLAAQ